jgi:hypothetical protein
VAKKRRGSGNAALFPISSRTLFCLIPEFSHDPLMKHAFGILTTLASAIALTSCGNQGTSLAEHPAGTGPFDSRGNYVEAWADNPEKWNRGGGSSRPATNRPKPEAVTPPVIARQEQPPRFHFSGLSAQAST